MQPTQMPANRFSDARAMTIHASAHPMMNLGVDEGEPEE